MMDYGELKRLASAIESCTSIPEEDEAAWMRRTTGETVIVLLDELDEHKAENKRLLARDAEHVRQFNRLSEFRQLTVERYDAKVAALEADNESLRKDAERYRWLRKKSIPLDGHDFLSSDEILDYRIDAAISKEASNG